MSETTLAQELRAAASSMRDDYENGLWPDWVRDVADWLDVEAEWADAMPSTPETKTALAVARADSGTKGASDGG